MADLRRARADLTAFAAAIGQALAVWQADALRLERRTTAVVAPRQSGKSCSLAVLALWWAFRHPGSCVLIVSAGDDAAKRLLALAARMAVGSPLLAGSVVDENSGLLVLSNGSEIRSVPASERAVRGWTVDLLLVDECAQVDDELLLSAAIPTTAARPDARIVLAGSPGAAEGAFHAFVTAGEQGSEHTSTFRWSLSDAAWITASVVDAAREQLAPAQFAREYEGRFADVGDETIVAREWIAEAQRRTLKPGPVVFGVDVARGGGDETVIMGVRGGVARVVWANRGADLMVTSGRVVALARDEPGPVPPTYIDAIGLGAGVLDRCRELGVGVPFISSARASRPERFLNLRAEAWWLAREAFRDGEVDLDPADRVLADQLGSMRYTLASSGAIQAGDKSKMRSSPDRADALVIALWARAQRLRGERFARVLEQARFEAAQEPEDELLQGVAMGPDYMNQVW